MRVLLISFVLLLGFTGCNRNKSNPKAKTTEAKVTEAKSTVQKIKSNIQETEEKLQLAEQQLQVSPQSEEAQRELTELQEALAKAKEELVEAQKEKEAAQKPVACARHIEESEYPCSKVCADIRKVHEAFQKYFYCMESNKYAHNSGAKSPAYAPDMT